MSQSANTNNPLPSDGEAERFLSHHQAIATAKRESKDASQELSGVRKAAKNDGIDADAYKMAEKLNDQDLSDEEIRAKLARTVNYLVFMGRYPKGTQTSLIDAPQVPKQAKAKQTAFKAGEDGLRAGREGEPESNNPHPAGSEPHQSYSQQYKRGLQERKTASEMQPADTENERPADISPATRHPGQKRRGGTALERARAELNGGATTLPN